MRKLEVVKKAKAAVSQVVAAVKQAVISKPKVRLDPFSNETARWNQVNAEAARMRAERARVLDELMSSDDDPGFLGRRRRGWLR